MRRSRSLFKIRSTLYEAQYEIKHSVTLKLLITALCLLVVEDRAENSTTQSEFFVSFEGQITTLTVCLMFSSKVEGDDEVGDCTGFIS